MFSGFLPLVLNPHAWVVAGLTALAAFSGGVYRGWTASNADHWKRQVQTLERAAEQKDKIISDNAERYLADQEETARLQAKLRDILNETDEDAACRLSDAELDKLRSL